MSGHTSVLLSTGIRVCQSVFLKNTSAQDKKLQEKKSKTAYVEQAGKTKQNENKTETPRSDGTFKTKKKSEKLVHYHESAGNSGEFCHDH